MIIGKRDVFGEDIGNMNKHWLASYGNFLILLSNVDMRLDLETLKLADLECDESENYDEWKQCQDVCHDFFSSKGLHVEGYTLRKMSEWFCEFCKSWHSKNREISLREKKLKIEKLKKEIEVLEGQK